MSKSFYSEYVNHMLNFFCKYPSRPDFKTDVDCHNWQAVESVMLSLCSVDFDLICDVYTSPEIMSVSVMKIAEKHQVEEKGVWELITDVSARIAKERGLI